MKRALAAALCLALPASAHACAVCGAAADRNRAMFLLTTILLSLLPLAMLGAGLLWVVLRSRERLGIELAERGGPFAVPGTEAGAPGSGVPAAPFAGTRQ